MPSEDGRNPDRQEAPRMLIATSQDQGLVAEITKKHRRGRVAHGACLRLSVLGAPQPPTNS
jgi:hypothetical protein